MPSHPIGLVEVASADPAEASRFYGTLFDWQISALPAGPDAFYHIRLAPENVSCAFPPAEQLTTDGQTGASGGVVFYVHVDDIDAMLTRASSLGGRTLLGKTEIPGTGWFAFFADPTGNRIGLFTPQAT